MTRTPAASSTWQPDSLARSGAAAGSPSPHLDLGASEELIVDDEEVTSR